MLKENKELIRASLIPLATLEMNKYNYAAIALCKSHLGYYVNVKAFGKKFHSNFFKRSQREQAYTNYDYINGLLKDCVVIYNALDIGWYTSAERLNDRTGMPYARVLRVLRVMEDTGILKSKREDVGVWQYYVA